MQITCYISYYANTYITGDPKYYLLLNWLQIKSDTYITKDLKQDQIWYLKIVSITFDLWHVAHVSCD